MKPGDLSYMSITSYSTMLRALIFVCVIYTMLPGTSKAAIVTMETTMGNIDIELFDSAAPVTVANFLNYVQGDDYVNSFIHRSVPGFVVQGGGFKYENNTFSTIPTDAPIMNEFNLSNLRGTIAMATQSGDPDSATSQWFFNLSDNSANLDFQNGGFTVFGQVLGNGMDIVDAIAALPVHPILQFTNPELSNVPINGWVGGDIQDINLEAQLVTISNISVTTVPIPSAIWLFGSGLLGLIGVAKRKK